jgi:hypothetical protein
MLLNRVEVKVQTAEGPVQVQSPALNSPSVLKTRAQRAAAGCNADDEVVVETNKTPLAKPAGDKLLLGYGSELPGMREIARCTKPHPHASPCTLEHVEEADGKLVKWSGASARERIVFEDLQKFFKTVDALPARIPEYGEVKALWQAAEKVAAKALQFHEMEDLHEADVPSVLDDCTRLFVEIPHLDELRTVSSPT